MSPPIHRGRSSVRLSLGLATVGWFFVRAVAINAQAPVITNPGDLHYLDVNTAFDPGDPNPAWKSMAPMPTARAGFAIAATSEKIYVIGGAVLNDCTTASTVEAYNPSLDLWDAGLAPLPPPSRWRPSGGALGDIIYVVGGASTENGCTGEALGTLQAYDPATDSWSDKPSMPTPRLQVGVGVDTANNLLYAIGGLSAAPDFTALDTVEVFDPTGNGGAGSWTTKQHLNTARGLPAVAAVNGKIYAIGGQTGHRGVIDTVEEYDPIADTWTTRASKEPPPQRLDPGTALLDSKVYVVGGEKGKSVGGPLSTVDVYDPTTDTWTVESSMLTARRVLGAVALNDTLYAVGGEAPIGKVDEQFTYQITATNNPTSYDASPLPDGLSVDHTRGIIAGIPTAIAQNFIVTFSATNASGTSSKDVSFYIGPADSSAPGTPGIVSGTCATARAKAGEPFTFQVLTNNASSTAQLAATGLPYEAGVGPELTIDPGTGIISGIVPPALDGSAQSFGIQLGLADGSTADQSYLELTFVSDPSLPVITSSSSAALVLNEFFSYTIIADAPANFLDYIGLDGNLDGSLPPGLSFDGTTGTISGLFNPGTVPDGSGKNPRTGHATIGRPVEDRVNGIDTIKKEPPPRIQLLAADNIGGTGTAPLNFIIGLHDFEIETLTDETSEGTDYTIFTDDPMTSGGAAGLLGSVKVGDYVSYTVPVSAIGTYDVKVGIRTNTDDGIFQLAIDGVNQGSSQDEYSPTEGYGVRDLGPVTFTSLGNKSFKFLVTGKNPVSIDYKLVLDYLDLVPYFEAESLPVQANSAPYRTIHDPNLSGGSGTLFEATQVGDYLSYTVPVAVAGAYNVTLGMKTSRDAGIFQLLIDGVNQGYAQTEYGPVTYGTLDLGTVVFANAGDKIFQFLVTAHDPKSHGYELFFDHIDLTLTTQLEAEMLHASATAQLLRITDANMSGQSGVLLNAQAVGRLVTYSVMIPVAGTYDIKLGIRTGNKSGIFQLAIDGVNQGSAQDEYSAEDDHRVLDLGKATFSDAGTFTFQFLVTGKNASSNGYQLVFDYIDLVR